MFLHVCLIFLACKLFLTFLVIACSRTPLFYLLKKCVGVFMHLLFVFLTLHTLFFFLPISNIKLRVAPSCVFDALHDHLGLTTLAFNFRVEFVPTIFVLTDIATCLTILYLFPVPLLDFLQCCCSLLVMPQESKAL